MSATSRCRLVVASVNTSSDTHSTRWPCSHPALAVAVFEKETELATHQTGRNSGVIHCGIYYPTGSLKAQLCVEGHRLTYEYCAARGIPVKQVGKLIVAVEEEEVPRLHGLYQRGVDNGVQGLKMLTADEITAMEPNVRGLAAVHCPTTGIVDWGLVAKHYAEDFVTAGGEVFTGHEVKAFEPLPHRADFADGVQLKVEVCLPACVRDVCGGGWVLIYTCACVFTPHPLTLHPTTPPRRMSPARPPPCSAST